MRLLPSNVRTPMIPLGRRGVGLLEKRLNAVSSVGMSQSVSFVGEWNRETDDFLLMDDVVEWHNNHAEDPATDTLAMSATAAFNMVRVRSLSDTINMTDFVHVALDGYHPPGTGNGGGDTYLDRHAITANETIEIGMPVYVSGNNTVNLADADSINTSHVLGLAETSGNATDTINVLSSGIVTKADWTSVTGSASLTPGAVYYLSTSAGQLTTTPPSGSGDAIVSCGLAITTTKLDIEINEIAVL